MPRDHAPRSSSPRARSSRAASAPTTVLRSRASRLLTLLAALPLLLLGVTACGGATEEQPSASTSGAEESATPTEEATEEDSASATSESTSEAPTESSSPTSIEATRAGDDAETGDPTEPEDGADDGAAGSTRPDDAPAPAPAPAPGSTELTTLWVDDSWTIEERDDDPCSFSGATVSPYSEQEDVFTCGATADSLLACMIEDGDTAVCITNPLERTAMRFDSPTARDALDAGLEVEGEPIPMTVELADGALCATVSHDHDTHWDGEFSWYRCDDGSELLTDEDITHTFDEGEPWTVQRSVDTGAPEETAVAVVAFAGV